MAGRRARRRKGRRPAGGRRRGDERMPDFSHPDLRFRTYGTAVGLGFRHYGRFSAPGDYLVVGGLMLALDVYLAWSLPGALRTGNSVITGALLLLFALLLAGMAFALVQGLRWSRMRTAYAARTGTPPLGLWRRWDGWAAVKEAQPFVSSLHRYGFPADSLADMVTSCLVALWEAANDEDATRRPAAITAARRQVQTGLAASPLAYPQRQELADKLYDLARLARFAEANQQQRPTGREPDADYFRNLCRSAAGTARELGLAVGELRLTDDGFR
jgi:hypothetical protein